MKKVALFGAGAMGSNHARIVAQSNHSMLLAIIDPNPITGQQLAMKYNCKWWSAIEDYSPFDYVIIASPTEVHFQDSYCALKQQVPVLIEKPVSIDINETKALLDLSREENTPLMCGLVERFNPAVLTVEGIIEDVIGIYTTRHSPMIPRTKTDIDGDLLIHDLDICMRFMDSEPHTVQSSEYVNRRSGMEIIDAMDVIAGFSGNRFANLSVSRLSHRKIRSLNLLERTRLIEVDLLRRDITIYKNVNEESVEKRLSYRQQTVIEIPSLITNNEPLAAQLDYFVRLLDERNEVNIEEEKLRILKLHQVLKQIRRQ